MIIGLTGQSGAGKTTLSLMFEKAGFFVINADLVAHRVTDGKDAAEVLKSAFGEEIFDGGKVNRRKLGAIVFSDKEKLEKLNRTLLPLIKAEIEQIIGENSNRDILLDAPTLFESGLNLICDKTVAVTCNYDILKKRIISRDFLTEDEAKKRLSSQKSDTFFSNNCDIVIDNSGSKDEFTKKSAQLISLLKGE